MYKLYILSFFAALLSLKSAGASTRDSIGVENYNGKKLILHKTIAKDTYYSIGRRYNVAPKDIMSFNDNKYLQIGVIIKVPTTVPFSDKPVDQASPNTAVEGNVVEHVVQKKENLNMLAKKYGTTVDEIKRLNDLRTINLQIGQVLKVQDSQNSPPQQDPATSTTTVSPQPVERKLPMVPSPATNPVQKNDKVLAAEKPTGIQNTVSQPVTGADSEEFIEHTVASNETIYSIATRYKLTIDQLKTKNKLSDNSLRVGQKLLIKGQYPAKPAYVPPVTASDDDEEPASDGTLKDPSLRYPASRYGLNQIDEKGTGIWITDPDLDPTKMLVLHRSAPIGGIIKITNPMSNRSTFAKVVGKFTENESTKDVIIVMTKAVADSLGALDKRFYCNITYGAQENEQK